MTPNKVAETTSNWVRSRRRRTHATRDFTEAKRKFRIACVRAGIEHLLVFVGVRPARARPNASPRQ
jgi:hypothetical protein